MIGNISKSKAQKGDPLTFDMLTEAEKASLSPKPDWNQTDETKADFIKNKPDLTKYATKEELNQEKFIRCDYEDIDSISTAGKYIVSVPDEKLPVRGDAYLFVSNVIANNNQFHQILIGADGTITKRSGNNSGSLDGVTKTIWSEWQTYATKEEIANVGGGNIAVDSELDENSENPVQNKVVTEQFNSLSEDLGSNISSIEKTLRSIDTWGIYTGTNSSLDEALANVYFDSKASITKLTQTDVENNILTSYIMTAFKNGEAKAIWFHPTDGVKERDLTQNKDGDWIIDPDGEWISYINQHALDAAIGNIETSLENIIAKYGLGGEAV